MGAVYDLVGLDEDEASYYGGVNDLVDEIDFVLEGNPINIIAGAIATILGGLLAQLDDDEKDRCRATILEVMDSVSEQMAKPVKLSS